MDWDGRSLTLGECSMWDRTGPSNSSLDFGTVIEERKNRFLYVSKLGEPNKYIKLLVHGSMHKLAQGERGNLKPPPRPQSREGKGKALITVPFFDQGLLPDSSGDHKCE